uniref:Cytochrome c-553 n=1 Tax=Taenioma perpusillum TaxID=210852 RepID=A0A1Z1MQQ1_9FLOR|nr:cytochrome c553 [Taenioma perpusillum]ARW68417.1 cytochrome c553 [Taenioma perpusillum]
MISLLKLLVFVYTLIFMNVNIIFAQDIEAGGQIFSQNCSACHANGKNLVNPEKTLEKEVLAKFEMNDTEAIIKQVTYGKNAMPAFGERLELNDIQNVASYVLNQSELGW